MVLLERVPGVRSVPLAAKEDGNSARVRGKSIELLRRAVAAGVDYGAFVRMDPDLLPVRDRSEFKQIVAGLKEHFGPVRAVAPAPRAR